MHLENRVNRLNKICLCKCKLFRVHSQERASKSGKTALAIPLEEEREYMRPQPSIDNIEGQLSTTSFHHSKERRRGRIDLDRAMPTFCALPCAWSAIKSPMIRSTTISTTYNHRNEVSLSDQHVHRTIYNKKQRNKCLINRFNGE